MTLQNVSSQLTLNNIAMPKIPQCDRCLLYSHDPHLICAVHPDGIDTESCLDFRPDPNIEEQQQWSPFGYSWYGDELIRDRSRYSQEEQIEILGNHPFFTGVCPQCRHEFNRDNLTVHFDCPNCNFIDDSV
jgi:hypothetical protein